MANLNNFNLILLLQQRERRQINRNRVIRDKTNPFEYDDRFFIKLFRLDKESVNTLIINLRNYIPPATRTSSLSCEHRVFATLRFYAQGGYQLSVGEDAACTMSQHAVSESVNLVTNAINDHLARQWIKFPSEPNELNMVRRKFYEKYRMSGVVGVIDGTHIAICAPPKLDPLYPEHLYLNRKSYHSINTQIITDADGKILNVNALYPGSTHDSFIWANSQIRNGIETMYIDGRWNNMWLLGDSGYPLQPWLMIPYRNPIAETPEMRYNIIHKRTRACVERTIGLLKSRWRCLLRHRTLHYSPPKVTKIINACVVLHNICKENNIPFDEELEEEDDFGDIHEDYVPIQQNLRAAGEIIRNRIINRY